MESLFFPSAMSSGSSSLSEEPNCLYSTTTDNRVCSSAVLIHDNLEEDSKDKCSVLPTSLPPPTLLSQQNSCKIKKKRSLPGNPDPGSEVIALSPETLLATNRFVCEICNKGFQRDQNLQLHRRGHNLPWKLKKRLSTGKDQAARKRVYVCPELACVHHHPSRALGDLTGIKKHYRRKHGEKKWKCEKCSKVYAVQSDWKAHMKTCGTREYRCDCGTLFSRRDSFITHRAFCDALAEESARLIQANQRQEAQVPTAISSITHHPHNLITSHSHSPSDLFPFLPRNPNILTPNPLQLPRQYSFPVTAHKTSPQNPSFPSNFPTLPPPSSHHLSATALLQKAASLGATTSTRLAGSSFVGHMAQLDYCLGFGLGNYGDPLMKKSSEGEFTRDFLGLQGEDRHHSTDHFVGEGPHSLIQNFGFLAGHPSISHVATASSRMWG